MYPHLLHIPIHTYRQQFFDCKPLRMPEIAALFYSDRTQSLIQIGEYIARILDAH
jgi:hypothetical protein